MMEQDTISLGEVFHRVATSIHKDLIDLVALSVDSNPEINTLAMISYVSRTRRKILQLLAAIRWLSTPRTKRILDALSTYYFNLSDFERRCDNATAEMHYVHSRIYAMRSPRPLVEDAMKLMTVKRVVGLIPPAVFQCGRKQYPSIEQTFMSDLSLVIRMKLQRESLGSSQNIFGNELKGSIKDGILTIVYSDLFRISCTLSTKSVEAPWRLLSYRILVPTGFEKYSKRREEDTHEFLVAAKSADFTTLRVLVNRVYHHAILNRMADYSDKIKETKKSLQSLQVIQDLRRGLTSSSIVFGFWKSDFSG